MSDVMSVYRKQEGGAVYTYNVKRQIRQAYHSLEIYKVFGKELKKISCLKFSQNALEAFWNSKGQGKIEYILLYDLIIHTPKATCKSIVKKCMSKINL